MRVSFLPKARSNEASGASPFFSAEFTTYGVLPVRAPLASAVVEPASTMTESMVWMSPLELNFWLRTSGKVSGP